MANILFKDHVSEGLGRMMSQWDNSPGVLGFTEAILENIQTLEDACRQVNDERGIYEAIGFQLDVIGFLLNVPRGGLNDTEYRAKLLQQASLNSSDGTPEKVMEILKVITNQDFSTVIEYPLAHTYGVVGGGWTFAVAQNLDRVVPAGVSSRLIIDVEENSFIPAGATLATANLVENNLNNLAVQDGGQHILQAVVGAQIIPYNSRSYLPHNIDTQLINPLAAILDHTNPPPTETGTLLLENGDNISDESGNIFIYRV